MHTAAPPPPRALFTPLYWPTLWEWDLPNNKQHWHLLYTDGLYYLY